MLTCYSTERHPIRPFHAPPQEEHSLPRGDTSTHLHLLGFHHRCTWDIRHHCSLSGCAECRYSYTRIRRGESLVKGQYRKGLKARKSAYPVAIIRRFRTIMAPTRRFIQFDRRDARFAKVYMRMFQYSGTSPKPRRTMK